MSNTVFLRTLACASTLALALALLASSASADAINSRQVSTGGSSETSLQSILDSVTGTGSYSATTDQSAAALFTPAGGTQGATMIIELAGQRNSNTFGLYQAGDTSTSIQIFSGSDATEAYATIEFDYDSPGGIQITRYSASDVLLGQSTVASFGSEFGLCLTDTSRSGSPTCYSEDSENSGHAYALMYQGDGASSLDLDRDGTFGDGTFATTDWIAAWEDLPWASTDRGYNDMVVHVSGFSPVPEPGTLALLTLGLGGLTIARRRRRSGGPA